MVVFQKTEKERRLTCLPEHGMCCKLWKVVHAPLLNSHCFYVFEILNLCNRDPKGDWISSLFLTDNCSYTVQLLHSHIETEWTHYKPGERKKTHHRYHLWSDSTPTDIANKTIIVSKKIGFSSQCCSLANEDSLKFLKRNVSWLKFTSVNWFCKGYRYYLNQAFKIYLVLLSIEMLLIPSYY